MTTLAYHETTKHHFNRFARSAGYLDWATQPNPFRRYGGASLVPLSREPLASAVPYDALYNGSAPPVAIDFRSVSELLRCSMGLSAWKQHQASRWALRVNPSSGNLHPTEAYIVWNGAVCHYAPREHALEQRAVIAGRVPSSATTTLVGAGPLDPAQDPVNQWLLVGFSSIFWREAWKYGERAFRYCQHDLGHALGALRLSSARLGWRVQLLTEWSDAEIATLLGLDRDDDFADAERESPECLALVAPPETDAMAAGDQARQLLTAAGGSRWTGAANRLSPTHVDWSIIERVAHATDYPGGIGAPAPAPPTPPASWPPTEQAGRDDVRPLARAVILQRRSAVSFDGRSSLSAAAFTSMMARLQPGQPPWDVVPWAAQVHLAVFVHRVDGLVPGIYAVVRDPAVRDEWQRAMRPQFLWESIDQRIGLFLLLPFDMMWPAMRVSCDQDIAGDGFFSLGMLAPIRTALRTHGEWFYRRLFWETGLVGQVLYLEAEAVGARSTGIGCFFDDAVHELLGLPLGSAEANAQSSPAADWQSLYHFSMGMPVEDPRLTSEPGYEWESEP